MAKKHLTFWQAFFTIDKRAFEPKALFGGVAQWSEHSVHTRGVTGSNPVTATIGRVGEAA